MSGRQGDGNIELPFVVSPPSLTFYADDPTSHAQNVTIYNPCAFALKFRLACDTRKRYHASVIRGVLESFTKIDIVITHIDIQDMNINETDTFYVHAKYETSLGQQNISRSLTATLMATNRDAHPGVGERNAAPLETAATVRESERSRVNGQLLVWLSGIVCIIGLFLPTYEIDKMTTTDEKSTITITTDSTDANYPSYLHLNYRLKLILAFALGMFTMAALRP